MDVYIKSITGEIEMLLDCEIARKDGVNGDKTISYSVTKTEGNEHAYPFVRNQNIFIYDGEEYVIKKFAERTRGKTTTCEGAAIHRMFEDLRYNYIYEQTSGAKTPQELFDFSIAGSGYTVVIDTTGLPASVEVQNFGDGKSTALLKSALEKIGAEFEVIGTTIHVAKELARYTDEQFRYLYNIKDPSQELSTEDFPTYIKGFGKKNEDGTYVVTAEYTSPLASLYGIKHADPVRDEKYTDYNSLLDRIKRELHDSIDISVKLTYVQLQELGITDVKKGDYAWCIIDPFGIDVQIRVVEEENYSNPNKSPVFTLGTLKKKASDIAVSFDTTQRTVNRVIDAETKIVKDTALSAGVNYVVKAVERTFSQIDYTEDGISASDATIFMKKVGLKKGGIYRTVDGVTRFFVITPDGITPSEIIVGAETQFEEGYDPKRLETILAMGGF